MIKSIQFTKPFIKATSPLYLELFDRKMNEVLPKFPELDEEVLHVGLTRGFGINALAHTQDSTQIKISWNPVHAPYYFTMGHELTHFVQDISDEYPHGETQCDVWTIARDRMFLDRAPGYLPMPVAVRNNWGAYADMVRRLCIDGISHRKNGMRQYIVWIRKEMRKL